MNGGAFPGSNAEVSLDGAAGGSVPVRSVPRLGQGLLYSTAASSSNSANNHGSSSSRRLLPRAPSLRRSSNGGDSSLYSLGLNNDSDSLDENAINVNGVGGREAEERFRQQYIAFMRNILIMQNEPSGGALLPPAAPANCPALPMAGELAASSSRSCGSSIFDSQLLDFEIVATDGGEYSPSYSWSNILRDDASVYCSSKSKNINILLRHRVKHAHNSEPVSFVISAIVI